MSTPTMPTTKVLPPSGADRSADADLLVDIPQLSVDELALEVEAAHVLDRVKLEAKGLQLSLYLKADLEHVLRVVQERTERHEEEPRHRHEGNGSRPHASTTQGAVAAGLTAAGLAGGALLEARVKPSRKLHIPRRRTRAQMIRDELVKRLP